MKGRRRIWWILAAAVVLSAIATVFWPREKEPVYQGKKLSEWLREYDSQFTPSDAARSARAANALQHMGSNAVPWLVRWICYEPAWPQKAMVRVVGWREWLWAWKIVPGLRAHEMRRDEARLAFAELGPGRRCAIPELERLALEPGARLSRDNAIGLLGKMGSDGLPTLIRVLDRSDIYGRTAAASAILDLHQVYGIDVSQAIPMLLVLDRESNEPGRWTPAGGMSFVRDFESEPAVLFPALTNCLWHSNPVVRVEAAQYLGYLGIKSVGAEPALRRALDDPDEGVRKAATNAVKRIVADVIDSELDKVWAHEK